MEFLLISQPQANVLLPGDMTHATVSLAGVNWEQEVALVVDLGEKRTGGYAVEILGANIAPGQIEVQVRVTKPGPRAFVPQVLTHPFALCRLSRTQLKAGPISIIARDQSGNLLAQQVVTL